MSVAVTSDFPELFEHPLTDDQLAALRGYLRGHGTAFLRITEDGQVGVINPADVYVPLTVGEDPA